MIFVIVPLTLTNLILALVRQKSFYSETRLATNKANLNAYKRILNWQPFLKKEKKMNN